MHLETRKGELKKLKQTKDGWMDMLEASMKTRNVCFQHFDFDE